MCCFTPLLLKCVQVVQHSLMVESLQLEEPYCTLVCNQQIRKKTTRNRKTQTTACVRSLAAFLLKFHLTSQIIKKLIYLISKKKNLKMSTDSLIKSHMLLFSFKCIYIKKKLNITLKQVLVNKKMSFLKYF